jgi:hypothetical protein
MSMSVGRGKPNNGNDRKVERLEPTLARPQLRSVADGPDPQEEQLKLASVSLGSVDRLTGMTADEIERVAERVLEGADETAALLRELAARVRENGVFANERLARFVRVTNQCADIARSLQQTVERRDEPTPPEPKKPEIEEPKVAEVGDAPALTPEQLISPEAIAAPKPPIP